jgi:hypothetical protein
VEIDAGKIHTADLSASRISVLSGTVAITTDGKVTGPTGPIRATDAAGKVYETMAAAGEFKLLLPAGRYVVNYKGEQTAETLAALTATVDVGKGGAPVSVKLSATENTRGTRQTLFVK